MEQQRTNISAEQKKILIEFVANHPELTHGKFSKEFTFKHAKALWEEVSDHLNALVGATKDWKKWRKTWHDMKSMSKSKGSSIKRSQNSTGGGPPIKTQLKDDDVRILEIIGPTGVEGHPEVMESTTTFDDITQAVHPAPNTIVPNGGENAAMGNVLFEILPTINIGEQPIATNYRIIEVEPNTLPQQVEPPPIVKTSTMATKRNADKENASITPKSRSRKQTLHHTITATDKLANQCEKKIEIKTDYYAKKLELYEKEVAAAERMAAALESMAEYFNTGGGNE